MALTEDENLRLRKGDFNDLMRTEIREFFMMLRNFEERMEEKVNALKQITPHGKD
jgi:protein involved in polysaccharide export with SLBB domain